MVNPSALEKIVGPEWVSRFLDAIEEAREKIKSADRATERREYLTATKAQEKADDKVLKLLNEFASENVEFRTVIEVAAHPHILPIIQGVFDDDIFGKNPLKFIGRFWSPVGPRRRVNYLRHIFVVDRRKLEDSDRIDRRALRSLARALVANLHVQNLPSKAPCGLQPPPELLQAAGRKLIKFLDDNKYLSTEEFYAKYEFYEIMV
ncbi:MAG: hypothetical protein ACREGH_04440 [Minisyncoccia bacterium]